MELEQLKYAWNQARAIPGRKISLQEIIRRKSADPLYRLRRNLKREQWLASLLYLPLAAWYCWDFNGRLPEPAIWLLLVWALFMYYCVRKGRLLRALGPGPLPVRQELSRRVVLLEKYLRLYLLADLLIPASLILMALLLYRKLPRPPLQQLLYPGLHRSAWPVGLLWIGLTGLSSLLLYVADRWWAARWYGDHIRRLRRILEDMQD
jgi:hypothetical protein